MIKVKNLNKYYHKNKSNEIHVINNTNLEIQAPGLVTFLGSSGAGKSTLLHVIGGLDKASGDVIYDNINFNKASKRVVDDYRNKHIGYIFQNYNLLPNLTVYENLKVQLELIQVFDKETVDKKINECLRIVGMEKYKRRKVTALSGGQQQRVSIARALVKGADVIIADEPTGNLDTKNSIEILNILKILSKKYLIILVTHDLNLAMHYSDRIIKIKDGTIIEDVVNENNNSLLHTDSNAIYLDDYEQNSFANNSSKIDLYAKNDEGLNMTIVIEDDAIYIENNNSQPIRVINENTDRYIIKGKIEEDFIDENTLLSLDYKKPEKRSFKAKFIDFCGEIKKTINRFIRANRKTKLLYLAFFVIGIVLCFCLNSLSISTTISNDLLRDVPKGTVRMDVANGKESAKYGFSLTTFELREILNDTDVISGVVDYVENPYVSFKVLSNRTTTINFGSKCYITTPKTYNGSDVLLKPNEVIVSNYIAAEIIEYTKAYNITSFDELIGREFYMSLPNYYQGNVIIKDIEYSYDYTFFVSDYIYFTKSKRTLETPAYGLNYIWDEDKTYFSNYNRIDIPYPGVLMNTSSPDVLISENLLSSFIEKDRFNSTQTQVVWKTSSSYFDVVGTIPEHGFNVIFKNRSDYESFVDSSVLTNDSFLPYRSYDIEVLPGGNLPVNDFEILLPNTRANMQKYPIGSTYSYYQDDFRLKVVGYFQLDYPNNIAHLYTNYRTAYLIKAISISDKVIADNDKTVDFYTADKEKLISYFKEIGYPANDLEKMTLEDNFMATIDASKLAIGVSVIIIVVMVLFIFFINRSKMLQNIYEIGVLRALGSKKGSIYKQYVFDSIIITTFTVVLGFTFTYFFTLNASEFIPGISVDIEYYYISILAIYVVMILASITPIVTLLRKTPIEIINKYDI